MQITATYSPEDNKLRLYASERLDAETYARVKEAGFAWAPKQQLFVAPRWTPAREDLALELAGDIEPEEMTLAERAQAKAERLEALANKRYSQAEALAARADDISQRFYMGQPILIGHHSERKARKDQERMQSAMTQSVKAEKAANYWLYRAEGVERFANMKNAPKVRANRIKTLLAELRDVQRDINAGHKALAIWAQCDTDAKITRAADYGRLTLAPFGTYDDLTAGRITHAEAKARAVANAERVANSPNRKRWIDHILNRIAFERSLLGDVPRFSGELTPVILQAFARTHGAEKPKATATDPGFLQLESPAPLPLHIGHGRDYLELSADEWRDVMQACGYVVPDEKPRQVSNKPAPMPLINPTPEEAERLQRIWNRQARRGTDLSAVKELTQARWSANSVGSYAPYSTIEIDATGARVWNRAYGKTGEPVARVRRCNGGGQLYAADSLVILTDKPSKPLPLDLDAIEAALDAAEAPDEIAFAGPFDPAKVTIKRLRSSVTQGSVEISYNGKRINQFQDQVGFDSDGQLDSDWVEIARRFIEGERSLSA